MKAETLEQADDDSVVVGGSLVAPSPLSSLPDGWQVVQIKDVYRFTQKPRSLHYTDFEHIPFVPMDCVPLSELFINRFILKRPDELTSGTYFERGDFLLAKITPSFENGKQGFVENLPLSFGVATTEVIPIQEIEGVSDKFYLFYYLLRHDVRTELAGKMEGSTGRQRLSKSTIENLLIPLPPLPEQRAIAQALRTVQEAKETRQREAILERERKAALMQHLFTYGTRNEPRRMTDIGEIPQSWQTLRLGEVGTRTQYGLSVRGDSVGAYPILRMNNLQDGKIVFDSLQYVDLTTNGFQSSKLNKGDLLFNRTNSYELVGKTAIFEEEANFVFASYLVRVVTDTTRLLPQFLNFYLNWNAVQRRLKMLASRGVSQSNISASKLSTFFIPLPSLDEQEQLASVLYVCDGMIAALEREAALLDELFRTLLDELMTGRRRINNENGA